MNKTFGYDESFGFQLMTGKAFYFYEKDDHIGFSYDGQHIQTGFTTVRHYTCCSTGAHNSFHFENMISFFASSEKGHYYVQIGAYPDN